MIEKKRIENANIIVGIWIILVNLYFIPFSVLNIINEGGPMGYGLLNFPIILFINLLLITALLSIKKSFRNSLGLLIINLIGAIISIFLLYLMLSTPLMD